MKTTVGKKDNLGNYYICINYRKPNYAMQKATLAKKDSMSINPF